MKRIQKPVVVLLAVSMLLGSLSQAHPAFAAEETEAVAETEAMAETEAVVETEAMAETEAVVETEAMAAAEAQVEAETEAETETPAEETAEYTICGDFTGGTAQPLAADPETGLYTYSADLDISDQGWMEYPFTLTLNGVDYGAQDWVIYDCVAGLPLEALDGTGANGVFELLLCNTRSGLYTFTLDPENLTLTVSGSSDSYGAFLVFPELLPEGELPYYYMDDLGEMADIFGENEVIMRAAVPSWDPDGFWDIQIASGGDFYGKDGLAIEGTPDVIYDLENGQTSQFATLDPHVWYHFYFGASSHKLVVKDGGRIECQIAFPVCAADGSALDGQVTTSKEAPFYEAETITVTAPEMSGYHFIGWYTYYTDQDTYEELLSTEKSYEYLVRDFSYDEPVQSLYAVFAEDDEVKVTGVSLDHTELALTAEESAALTAVIEPADAYNQKVSWSSSDETIASVDENGLVTAKAAGTAQITVTTEDGGFTAVCTVEVSPKVIPVSGIDLTDEEITLGVGLSQNLELQILPEGAQAPEIVWTSSDPSVAAVDANGVVTAGKKIDSAVITAKTADGAFSDSCTVNVKFRDVMDSTKYFYKPIYWAAAHDITKGYLNESDPLYGQFGADVNCTRGALMVFLWRLAGKPSVTGITNPFNDVKKSELGATYYNAILWGSNKGITRGYSDGGFHPNGTLTRKDIMIMLYRYAGKPTFTDKKGMKFTDVVGVYGKNTDTYKAIGWGYNKGITSGYSSGPYAGQFGCNLDCLRKDIVTFLWRYEGKPEN